MTGLKREAALSSLDVSQLRLLQLLLVKGGVTAAADAIGSSQPAVSLRLARLREVFGDPLLVRSGAGMILTERAQALIEPLNAVLDGIERLAEGGRPFDPSVSQRQFRIAAPNYLGASLFPDIAAVLTGFAPHIRLHFQVIVPGLDYEQALAENELDFLIGNWPNPPQHLLSLPISKDRLMCFFSQSHPLAGRRQLSLPEYLELDHISPTPPSDWRFSPVDAQLARMRKSRRITIVLPDYMLMPPLVANSRLVLTTGENFAPIAKRMADVAIAKAPDMFEPIEARLLWHERSQLDKAHSWARTIIRRIAQRKEGYTKSTAA